MLVSPCNLFPLYPSSARSSTAGVKFYLDRPTILSKNANPLEFVHTLKLRIDLCDTKQAHCLEDGFMSSKILVTGATGATGRKTVKFLLNRSAFLG